MKVDFSLDTSSKNISFAVERNGEIFSKNIDKNYSSEKIPLYVNEFLKENSIEITDLGRIFVAIGPGSFTGLKIGISFARTLSQFLKIPLYGINIFDVFYKKITCFGETICILRNSSPGKVFTCLYKEGKRITDIKIRKIEDFLFEISHKLNEKLVFSGDAAETYSDLIRESLEQRVRILSLNVNAEDILIFGKEYAKNKKGEYKECLPIYPEYGENGY